MDITSTEETIPCQAVVTLLVIVALLGAEIIGCEAPREAQSVAASDQSDTSGAQSEAEQTSSDHSSGASRSPTASEESTPHVEETEPDPLELDTAPDEMRLLEKFVEQSSALSDDEWTDLLGDAPRVHWFADRGLHRHLDGDYGEQDELVESRQAFKDVVSRTHKQDDPCVPQVEECEHNCCIFSREDPYPCANALERVCFRPDHPGADDLEVASIWNRCPFEVETEVELREGPDCLDPRVTVTGPEYYSETCGGSFGLSLRIDNHCDGTITRGGQPRHAAECGADGPSFGLENCGEDDCTRTLEGKIGGEPFEVHVTARQHSGLVVGRE